MENEIKQTPKRKRVTITEIRAQAAAEYTKMVDAYELNLKNVRDEYDRRIAATETNRQIDGIVYACKAFGLPDAAIKRMELCDSVPACLDLLKLALELKQAFQGTNREPASEAPKDKVRY